MIDSWIAGLTGDRNNRQEKIATSIDMAGVRNELCNLKEQVRKTALINQALWELIRQRLNLTDDDLVRIAQEIDQRDGVEDGKLTESPLKCPQCGRISNSRYGKCLYCGLEFEKPAMG